MDEKKRFGGKAIERDGANSNSLEMAEEFAKKKRESLEGEGKSEKVKSC